MVASLRRRWGPRPQPLTERAQARAGRARASTRVPAAARNGGDRGMCGPVRLYYLLLTTPARLEVAKEADVAAERMSTSRHLPASRAGLPLRSRS